MKLTVLIVDADRDCSKMLTALLYKNQRVEKVEAVSSAREALTLFERQKIDLLVLDPFLPEMDGVTLLEELLARDLHPGVFVISGFCSCELSKELDELGVAQCMAKPVDTKRFACRVECWDQELGSRLGKKQISLQRRISQLLRELGMSTLSGYYDCCCAIEWLCYHPQAHGRITKELYPYIAQHTGQGVRQVERNIRYAIERTWRIADLDILMKYFGYTVDPESSRPSNAAFLRTLADHIRASGSSAIG